MLDSIRSLSALPTQLRNSLSARSNLSRHQPAPSIFAASERPLEVRVAPLDRRRRLEKRVVGGKCPRGDLCHNLFTGEHGVALVLLRRVFAGIVFQAPRAPGGAPIRELDSASSVVGVECVPLASRDVAGEAAAGGDLLGLGRKNGVFQEAVFSSW